jgi:lactoylglutathione lyase
MDYLGNVHGFSPTTVEEKASCQQLCLDVGDVTSELFSCAKDSVAKAKFTDEGRLENWLTHLHKAYLKGGSTFMMGDKPNQVDFMLVAAFECFDFSLGSDKVNEMIPNGLKAWLESMKLRPFYAAYTAQAKPILFESMQCKQTIPGTTLGNPRLQQTMLRIKDPKVSVPFYEKNFGMKLVHWIEFKQWKFTVYFLERQREGQTSPECTMEKTSAECEAYLNNMDGCTLELTHNHGTENDDTFKVWNGNTGKDAGKPGDSLYAEEPAARGFGHVAFNTDDVYAATGNQAETTCMHNRCTTKYDVLYVPMRHSLLALVLLLTPLTTASLPELLLANGVAFHKKPDEGRMKGLAFALDPDGYWIELVCYCNKVTFLMEGSSTALQYVTCFIFIR